MPSPVDNCDWEDQSYPAYVTWYNNVSIWDGGLSIWDNCFNYWIDP